MPKGDPAGYLPNVKRARSDDASVKTPRYQGRNNPKPNTPSRPPIPVGGITSEQRGKGPGPGGRFGRGGWQASSKRMKKNFLARTPEQELETQKKRAMRETKRKVIKSRIAAVKTGPNEKQNQLLGGE